MITLNFPGFAVTGLGLFWSVLCPIVGALRRKTLRGLSRVDPGGLFAVAAMVGCSMGRAGDIVVDGKSDAEGGG